MLIALNMGRLHRLEKAILYCLRYLIAIGHNQIHVRFNQRDLIDRLGLHAPLEHGTE